MTETNINIFISSKNRIAGEPYNFTCYLPDNEVVCNSDQEIRININSFDMINTLYNVNQNNNKFEIYRDDIVTKYEFPYGNYNPYNIIDLLNSIVQDLEVLYYPVFNKFHFKNKNTSINKFEILPINCGGLFGLENILNLIPSDSYVFSTKPINVLYFNKIIIRANNLIFNKHSFENINTSSNEFEKSDILLWINKSDTAPFSVISYNNIDSGNSYNYSLYNRSINEISFRVTNEFNELIEDLNDWTMSVQFSIVTLDADKTNKLLELINGYLREIYVFLTLFYNFITGYNNNNLTL